MADHELLPEALRAKAPAKPRQGPEHGPNAAHGQEAAGLPSLIGNAAFTNLVRSGGAVPGGGAPGGAAVHRAAAGSQGAGPLDPEIASAIDAQRGGGAPLPRNVRADMEHHLGHGFENVRVHTGAGADTVSRAVQAEAFTTGTDVFFASGRYDPESSAGRGLLAHELTHVVQQSTGAVDNEARVSHPGEPSEVQAAQVGAAVASAPAATAAAGPTVARQEAAGEEEDEDAAMVQRQESAEEDEEEAELA
jgi:Domain of unknown function (DUF4157)